MLTYVGKGYSQSFTDNYDRIIDELNIGDKAIELIKSRPCGPAIIWS
jgi:hypothetical protein